MIDTRYLPRRDPSAALTYTIKNHRLMSHEGGILRLPKIVFRSDDVWYVLDDRHMLSRSECQV